MPDEDKTFSGSLVLDLRIIYDVITCTHTTLKLVYWSQLFQVSTGYSLFPFLLSLLECVLARRVVFLSASVDGPYPLLGRFWALFGPLLDP